MLKFYLNHRRFIVVVSFDQPSSLGDSSRIRRGKRERQGEIIVDFVEEESRRSTETRRDHRRGVVEEASRRPRDTNTIKSSIDHGAVGEIERHKETSAPIDHSAIMVESMERSVSSREKMAESSREKHTRLVFREREKKKRGVLRE
ncbi:hypothetical protein F2Q68_00044035 [Brassica cretica]|uniref:Uncharacterized protein n=2 Tax=Brassica cretica TaxID=69181 RepID=A0ABQ7AUH6_BRACR|nr:hypothetical protein F2Q68_00044035 [Brassica cretica]KAF3517795.1 hypothetical protein DY000_02060069 [Brassica cretica]